MQQTPTISTTETQEKNEEVQSEVKEDTPTVSKSEEVAEKISEQILQHEKLQEILHMPNSNKSVDPEFTRPLQQYSYLVSNPVSYTGALSVIIGGALLTTVALLL